MLWDCIHAQSMTERNFKRKKGSRGAKGWNALKVLMGFANSTSLQDLSLLSFP